MPGSKIISEIYKEQKNSFLKHLKSAKTLEEENIHKLRVDVKRLRSLLRFLEVLSRHKFEKKKVMKLISPVFKSGGKIRDTNLNIKLTKVYGSNAILGFKTFLQTKEKQEEKLFRKEIKKFDKKEFSKLHKKTLVVLKKADHRSLKKISQEYIKYLFSKIKADMPNISNDENFHDVRKKLKDIKTITELLLNVAPEKKLTVQQKKVDTIEEKIGKWNDIVTLVKELEKFIAANKTTNEKPMEKYQKNKDNEKLSILVLNLKARNQTNKQLIAEQLKKKLF